MSSNFKHKIPFPTVTPKVDSKENDQPLAEEIPTPEETAIAILILAAGNSSRLGEPKQLVQFQGKPLIRHIVEQALFVKTNAVYVVLGANEALISPEIQYLPTHIVVNEDWKKGMGSSISIGVKTILKKYPRTTGVVVMLCDQPFVSADLIYQMIQKQAETKAGIVATSYAGGFGVPAFFSSSFFESLINLKKGKGAKQLIQQNLTAVESIPFPEGIFDIDTPEDLARIDEWAKIRQQKNKMRR